MSTTMQSSEQATESVREFDPGVEALAQGRLIDNCPYRFYFRDVTLRCAGGVLMLRGRVPTFYLKQVLQSLLKGLEGVERIDNRVDVVSAQGLSSLGPP